MAKRVKRVASIIITLALVLSLLSGCQFIQVDPEVDKQTVVAEVSGEKVKKAEFLELFDVIKEQYELQFGESIWEQQVDGKKYIDTFKEKVLDTVIDNRIQENKAKELGITVTDEEINAEVNKAREYFDTEEKFNEFLTSRKMTMDYLKDSIRTDLINSKLREKLTESITVTDEEVASYYNSNLVEFESVKASHILVATEQEAKDALAKVKAGKDFNELAKEISTDPTAAENSGDLGYFKHGDMVEEFETAAFALKPGELSEPVKTDYGYHIIKVEDKKVETLDEVKDELKNTLLTEKKDTEYSKLLEEMRTAAGVKKYVNKI